MFDIYVESTMTYMLASGENFDVK